jgi:hypothetical protein
MELSEHTSSMLGEAVQAKELSERAISEALAQERARRTALENLRQRLYDLRIAVEESTDLSDIERSALLMAIEHNREDPGQIEAEAQRLEAELERAQEVFSQQNVPVFGYLLNQNNNHTITSGITTGSGLTFDRHNTVKSTITSEHYRQGVNVRINWHGINAVLASPEEIEKIFPGRDVEDWSVSKGVTWIAGKDTFLAFVRKVYGVDPSRGYDNSLDERLLKRAAEVDIDLEKEVDVIADELEEKRNQRAFDVAKQIFDNLANGYMDYKPERLVDIAEDKGVPPELIVKKLEELRQARMAGIDIWLDDTRGALADQYQTHPEDTRDNFF